MKVENREHCENREKQNNKEGETTKQNSDLRVGHEDSILCPNSWNNAGNVVLVKVVKPAWYYKKRGMWRRKRVKALLLNVRNNAIIFEVKVNIVGYYVMTWVPVSWHVSRLLSTRSGRVTTEGLLLRYLPMFGRHKQHVHLRNCGRLYLLKTQR